MSSSVKISAEKVMVTILVNDSWKNKIVPSIITAPWKTDLKNQMRKVFTESDRPFCNVAYRGGYFMTTSTLTSVSVTREKTGMHVYIVE